VLALRLGQGRGATIGAIAGQVAGAAVVPLIRIVAVEVGAPSEGIAAAISLVSVLEPGRFVGINLDVPVRVWNA
jgi:hypothetical protein